MPRIHRRTSPLHVDAGVRTFNSFASFTRLFPPRFSPQLPLHDAWKCDLTTTLHFWRVKHSERKLSRCRKTTAAAKQVHTETAVCWSRSYLPAPLGSKQPAAALQWTALSHVLHDWEGLMLRCSYRMCRPDVYFAVKFEPTADVDLSTQQHPKVWIHLL